VLRAVGDFIPLTVFYMQAYNNHAGSSVTVCLHAHVCVCACAQKHTCFTTTTTIHIHFRNATGNVKENHKIFKMNATHQLLHLADEVISVCLNSEILLRKREKS